MKQRNAEYYRTLEAHVVELMRHGITLPKWMALQAQLAHVEAKLKVVELGVERLREAVKAAEAAHKHACLNLGNSAQVACSAKVETLKAALELITG